LKLTKPLRGGDAGEVAFFGNSWPGIENEGKADEGKSVRSSALHATGTETWIAIAPASVTTWATLAMLDWDSENEYAWTFWSWRSV
jgi:hypothetical protein